jgi:hypothetical protein
VRHDADVDTVGLALFQKVEVHLVVFDQRIERGCLLAVVVQLLDGHTRIRTAGQRGGLAHEEQPLAVRIRQRFEQHAVYHAEDGGIGADTEAERQDREHGERPVLPQCAERDPDVLYGLLHREPLLL